MTTLDSNTKTLLRDPVKRRAWVVYQVAIQGRSLAEIAREKGVKRQTLYAAFDKPYPRMEKILADAVGLTPQELFPERYTKEGLPARKMGRPRKLRKRYNQESNHNSSAPARRNVHRGEAE